MGKRSRRIMESDLGDRKTRTWTIEEAAAVLGGDSYTLNQARDRILEFYRDKHKEMDYETLEAAYNLAFDVPPKGRSL